MWLPPWFRAKEETVRLSFVDERVLAVVAHPDDAELLCAGTLARGRADGAAIGVCVLCRGDKGRSAMAPKNLAAVRAREMRRATRRLGSRLFLGGYPDGRLADAPGSRRRLVEILRRFQPTLILAHWPGDYHADHRAASQLAEAASWFCASRGHRTRSPAMPAAPALWWMDTLGMTGFEPGFYVDVGEFVGLKDELLQCHTSQLERGGDPDFEPLLELMRDQNRTRGRQAGVLAAEAFRQHHAFKRIRAW